MNDSENDSKIQTVRRLMTREPTRVGTNRLIRKGLIKEKGFEFKSETYARRESRGVESVVVLSN